MNSTALGAGAEKAKDIIFISEAHEKFYYEKLKEVRYQDVYHKALCYCLGISDDTRRNANRMICSIKRILKMYRKVSDITGQIYYDCIL